jgi:hypothetical protein
MPTTRAAIPVMTAINLLHLNLISHTSRRSRRTLRRFPCNETDPGGNDVKMFARRRPCPCTPQVPATEPIWYGRGGSQHSAACSLRDPCDLPLPMEEGPPWIAPRDSPRRSSPIDQAEDGGRDRRPPSGTERGRRNDAGHRPVRGRAHAVRLPSRVVAGLGVAKVDRRPDRDAIVAGPNGYSSPGSCSTPAQRYALDAITAPIRPSCGRTSRSSSDTRRRTAG